jgi:phosphatidylglycerophosphate synthase
MSWQLPHVPLLGRVVATLALGLATALAVAAVLAAMMPLTAAYQIKVAAGFVVVALVALGYVGAYHPFSDFGAANVVTTIRAALVALIAALIGEPHLTEVAWAAAAFAAITVLLDGVDGWLARRSSMSSSFGARYDMELDALLILVLAILAWRQDKAGAWIVLVGAMRYIFVAAGYLWWWLDAPLPPSVRRKAICVVQIVGLGAIVSPFVTIPFSIPIAAAMLAVLAWSFAVDVLWLRRHGA